VAEGIAGYLKPEEIHKLGRLVLLSRYVVEGNLAGVHRSPQRGASTEFADHRAYIQGDDPKHIDWKVFGRSDRYYVKRYEDETNLRVYIVLDRSASMGYGPGGMTKYRYACHLAAAIGYVVVKARDSVGLFLHSDKVDTIVEPGNTFLHLNNMLKRMQETQPGASTQMGDSLNLIAESVHKRALIVIISDLLGAPEDLRSPLAHFRRSHHDVIVFHVLDPTEIELPFRNGALFEDMETGESIAIDPRSVAKAYQEIFGQFMAQCRSVCAEMDIDYQLARTDRETGDFVRAYLDARRCLSR
jgi:uncharacterized protein (DUF58 family)